MHSFFWRVRALGTYFQSHFQTGSLKLQFYSDRMFIVAHHFIAAVLYRLGRQRVMWFTSAGQFVFGITVAFTFDYYSFVIVRFLLAMVRKELTGSFTCLFLPLLRKTPFFLISSSTSLF